MPAFLAWIDDDEPLSLDLLVAHARLGSDEAAALDTYLQTVVIPAARQLAEVRSGAAIRRARFQESRPSAPRQDIQLGIGQVYDIEQVTVGDATLDPSHYELEIIDKDPRVRRVGDAWPVGKVTVVYQAGIEDLSRFPTVLHWMLLAATWMLEQPSMFTLEQAVQEMPSKFIDGLLAPISIDCRV